MKSWGAERAHVTGRVGAGDLLSRYVLRCSPRRVRLLVQWGFRTRNRGVPSTLRPTSSERSGLNRFRKVELGWQFQQPETVRAERYLVRVEIRRKKSGRR